MKTTALVLVAALLAVPACRRREKIRVQATDEESASLASIVHTADPKTAPQLLKGFHAVEQNAWRWTMAKFAVALRPPKDAARKGAVLTLKFAVPDPVISRLKTVSLSAAVGGTPLSPETYTQAGEFTYTREVDARLLTGEAVNVEFTVDKAIPPGEVDQRELAVIVTSVGFEAK